MKKWIKRSCLPAMVFASLLMFGSTSWAAGENTISSGVFAGEIDLSGMTEAQAAAAVEAFVSDLSDVEITLLAADNNQVVVTAGDLGIAWINPSLVSEAAQLGTQGNVIERYKAMKDLQHENMIYPIQLSFDLQLISDLLNAECTQYDRAAEDAYLIRENGQFSVVEGQIGYTLDVESSIDTINDYLTGEWDYAPCSIELNVLVEEPRGSVEELSAVQDILGSYTTSFVSSGFNRAANVEKGCSMVNGTLLYPGDEFSTIEALSPMTLANGYYAAGAYLNGKVVDAVAGGVCQVSTTLYDAVLLAELEVTQRYNHSMVVTYVKPSEDAAIAEESGKDFCFVNNLDHPIYIEGYVENQHITFNIYGVETRGEGYEVRYESEVLEVISPEADVIYEDPTQPIGYIVTDSAFTGYKARLWKIVTQDGVEISRTQVNSSSYKMVPRSATVGTATEDPQAYEQIMAAIGTANIDHVKNVIALLVPPAPAPETPQ